ncbi:HNH endonuclease [Salmonella enterica]|nr:HNH endonuclease [Salmonella enterica]
MPLQRTDTPPDELRDLIYYEDGNLYWQEHYRRGSQRTDKPIGSVGKRGYKVTMIKVNGETRFYYIHRLIWWLVNDDWPELIDHINRDPLDNRIENLRVASNSANARNRNKSGEKSPFIGIYKQKNLYRVKVGTGNKGAIYSYGYRTAEAAALARDILAYILYPEHSPLNVLDKPTLSINGTAL